MVLHSSLLNKHALPVPDKGPTYTYISIPHAALDIGSFPGQTFTPSVVSGVKRLVLSVCLSSEIS